MDDLGIFGAIADMLSTGESESYLPSSSGPSSGPYYAAKGFPSPRQASGFVGLENQCVLSFFLLSCLFSSDAIRFSLLWVCAVRRGATCYMNSLIQLLYMCPEFRQSIFQLSEKELGVQAWHEEYERQEKLRKEREQKEKELKEQKEKEAKEGKKEAPVEESKEAKAAREAKEAQEARAKVSVADAKQLVEFGGISGIFCVTWISIVPFF